MQFKKTTGNRITVIKHIRSGSLTTHVQTTVPLGRDIDSIEQKLLEKGREKITWGDRELNTTTDLQDKYDLEIISIPNKTRRSMKRREQFLYIRSQFPELEMLPLSDPLALQNAAKAAALKKPSYFINWAVYFRSAARKNKRPDLVEAVPRLVLNDQKYEIWNQNKDLIFSGFSGNQLTVLKIASKVPSFNIEYVNYYQWNKIKRIGRLCYLGSDFNEFFPIPDCVSNEEVDVLLASNLTVTFLDKIQQTLSHVCFTKNINFSLTTLKRFAIKDLILEGYPTNLLTTPNISILGGWKSHTNSCCAIDGDLVSSHKWRKCLQHLKKRFRFRPPGFDASAIMIALFGRSSCTLDRIQKLSDAIIVAELFILSQCKSFANIADTDIWIEGNILKLSDFRPSDFGIVQEANDGK